MNVVSPADQAAGQVGHEGLRSALLRFADGRNERGHDGDLHRGSILKARSRGGLMLRISNGTRRLPRCLISSTASG